MSLTSNLHWWHADIAVFLVSLSLSLIFTPLCQKLATKTGFVDCPKAEAHKKHKSPIPLLGGLAMFSAWFITVATGIIAALSIPQNTFSQVVQNNISAILSPPVIFDTVIIISGALLATLLGLIDDYKPMKAKVKLIFQIIIAIFVVLCSNTRITLFMFDNEILSIGITIFWIVLIFNSINFFDNMDGLAAGTATIALFLFATCAIITNQQFIAPMAIAGAGAALGFWFFNHSPASIFMGDSGSHFLGYLLSITAIRTTFYNTETTQTMLAPLIPLFILAIPLFDTLMVVIIRLRNKKPIYIGDHNHISHRFVATGMNRKTAVLCVHLLCIIIGLGVIPLIWGDLISTIIITFQSFTILLLITILQNSIKKDQSSS